MLSDPDDIIEGWVDGMGWILFPVACLELLLEYPWMFDRMGKA